MFDLNVPIASSFLGLNNAKKSNKGKQPVVGNALQYTGPQIAVIEARVDLLIHLGYTAIAFNQTVNKKVDPKTHVNILDILLKQLKPRKEIVYMKRLTIILDEDSEKGFGLINAQTSLFNSYDLISLVPTNQATLALACLTHSLPSPLTAHIISIPLTLPRLPFNLKHTLVRTAIKNGAVFEINYVGAVGGDNDTTMTDANAAENGASAKRNWWGAARELTRVTKGKGLIVSSGAVADLDFRAPDDVKNLITLLGVSQDISHCSVTKSPKSLVLRAQTRKTYRAVLSEPQLVVPDQQMEEAPESIPPAPMVTEDTANSKKRPRDEPSMASETDGSKRKKKKRGKEGGQR
ncbi:PHP domain-like protein [Hymenopellis radicata]|nr:PHP domain-like protein [Hymenopellis radicata]